MNEIRPVERDAAELARARQIVSGHDLPDFITSFDVKLGLLEGEPALFVVYHEAVNKHHPRIDEVLRRSEELSRLDAVILPELLDAFEDRIPLSMVEPAPQEQKRL
jgi:hypothetical protein